ncbi:ABC transporter permease [Marinicauda salina]|uniref:ABC transporter permease n=1 Tax=Marinicauda salina TaxID=2135793 RepID=A0A2U2BTN4_9PROT|nr:ABC transporter permease [Marinicauda salina]PWE17361.1 ABC transporter permease [Marinicauda salina]
MNPVQALGAGAISLLRSAGRITLFAGEALAAAARPPWFAGQFAGQVLRIGFLSLPVVGLTALFTGAALALNIYTGGARFNAESFVPNIVAIGIVRELGPVIAALMLAGRVSSGIAAEIGAMRATEQIDALHTLSTDPMRYLIAPRILAGLVTLPLLVTIADIIGVFGGYLVAVNTLDFDGTVYIRNTVDTLERWDFLSGLIKAAAFGFLLTLMGCYHGFHAKGGAQGVGRAATHAVVSAAVLIFAANFLLTSLFV